MVGDEEIIEKQLRAWKIPLFQQPEMQRGCVTWDPLPKALKLQECSSF